MLPNKLVMIHRKDKYQTVVSLNMPIKSLPREVSQLLLSISDSPMGKKDFLVVNIS